MATRQPATPEEYLESLAPERYEAIAAVRALIRETVPQAEESIDWGMLRYTVEGKDLVALASQKRHMSLYLMELYNRPELQEKYGAELSKLDMGKSCLRFRSLDRLPLETIRNILRDAAR